MLICNYFVESTFQQQQQQIKTRHLSTSETVQIELLWKALFLNVNRAGFFKSSA